jgi:hypothetical protein
MIFMVESSLRKALHAIRQGFDTPGKAVKKKVEIPPCTDPGFFIDTRLTERV